MRTVAIIQARMGSTRLPGKVLLPLDGSTVLGWVVRRVTACRRIDRVVVATSREAADDAVAVEAQRHGAALFRGSEADVLSRYCGAAREHEAGRIVRVTADCPLYDPGLLCTMLERFDAIEASGVAIDYLSNGHGGRSWPRGLDTEIFARTTLETVCAEASQPHELEHVTPYIYQHPERFALHGFAATENRAEQRWTLDTADDWRLIEAVYTELGDGRRIFTTEAVLDLFERRPELVALNRHVEQKGLTG